MGDERSCEGIRRAETVARGILWRNASCESRERSYESGGGSYEAGWRVLLE